MPGNEKTRRILARWGELKRERASWMSHWESISTNILPRNGRYFSRSRNKGGRKHNEIYDSTATRALRTLGAGMMAGATSPARPWFRLTTSDPEVAKAHEVRLWLDDITRRLQLVFQRSNTYRTLHGMYEELGAFGTAAAMVLPDDSTVIHHYPATAGEYAIATDGRGAVDTIYREFDMTVSSVVETFGLDAVSRSTRTLYDRGNYDAWVTIIHAVQPRRAEERDPRGVSSRDMPFASCYVEEGKQDQGLLRESGFLRFPCVAPRWHVAGGDIYGNGPGMEALGDVRQLQHEQYRKAQAIDLQTRPPLQAPMSMKGREISGMPGGVSYVDVAQQQAGIRSAWEVNTDLAHLLEDIRDIRSRINSTFYADLFLMLANATDTRMTATEVAERHEEKLLMLGPVLERLHNELLDPLVDITFQRMMEAGFTPPPPPDIQGQELTVEFVSMLAQAQRAIATHSIDRFVINLGQVATLKPEVMDKLDADEWVEAYSDMLGVPQSMIIGGRDVALVRKQRAEAAQAQHATDQAQQQADAASKLARVPSGGGDTMVRDLLNQFSGYTSPAGTEV